MVTYRQIARQRNLTTYFAEFSSIFPFLCPTFLSDFLCFLGIYDQILSGQKLSAFNKQMDYWGLRDA